MTLSPFQRDTLDNANARVAAIWTDTDWTDTQRVAHLRHMERTAITAAAVERAGTYSTGPSLDWADVYEREAETYRRAIDGIRATDPDTGAARVNAGVRLAWTDGAAWVHA